MINKIKKNLAIILPIVIISAWWVLFINRQPDIIYQVNDFSQYQEIIDSQEKYLGDDCISEEFNQFRQLTENGVMKKLTLAASLEIIISPNYYQWSKEKFLSFNDPEAGAFCGAGGFFPLYADQENLWWIKGCSSGYQPNQKDINYQEFIHCQESEEIVRDYFAKK